MFHLNSDYLLVNNEFKSCEKITFNDIIDNDFSSFTVNNFNLPTSNIYVVESHFKKYYFSSNSVVDIKNLLTNKIEKESINNITSLDRLIINKRTHLFEKQNIGFRDKLFINKYNYSTSYADIISKYKLPKHFLLKALTTGCPDEEYPEAKEYNKILQDILDKGQLTLEEFKNNILNEYSNELPTSSVKISYKLLDLISLYISGDYEILSHTSLKLKVKNKKVFENIVSLLIDLNINKTVYNDIYNKEEYSIILLNSSFIYNLFSSEFDNFSFILKLSKLFSNYLYKLISNNNNIYLNSKVSSLYVQEFLYRFSDLYSLNTYNSDIYILEKIKQYKVYDNHIEIDIREINSIDNNTNFIGMS